jgi:hypothetical protein
MTDGVKVTVNIPDFRRQLAALGSRVEGNIAVRGLRAAGRVFRDEVRLRAPVLDRPTKGRTVGALKRSIYTGRSKLSRKGKPVHFVGVRAMKATKRNAATDPFYWRWLEGGWMPRGRGQGLRGGNRSRALQRRRNLQSGGKRISYPFIAPAFKAKQRDALRAFNIAVDKGISEENRKRK